MSDDEIRRTVRIAVACDRLLHQLPTRKIHNPMERDRMHQTFADRLVDRLKRSNVRFYRGPPAEPHSCGGGRDPPWR